MKIFFCTKVFVRRCIRVRDVMKILLFVIKQKIVMKARQHFFCNQKKWWHAQVIIYIFTRDF